MNSTNKKRSVKMMAKTMSAAQVGKCIEIRNKFSTVGYKTIKGEMAPTMRYDSFSVNPIVNGTKCFSVSTLWASVSDSKRKGDKDAANTNRMVTYHHQPEYWDQKMIHEVFRLGAKPSQKYRREISVTSMMPLNQSNYNKYRKEILAQYFEGIFDPSLLDGR
jgi:hypothetical protein